MFPELGATEQWQRGRWHMPSPWQGSTEGHRAPVIITGGPVPKLRVLGETVPPVRSCRVSSLQSPVPGEPSLTSRPFTDYKTE